MLFNNAINCWDYIALAIDECVCGTCGMILTANLKQWGKNMYHHHFVQHTPNMDWTGIEPGSLWWKTSDCQSHDTAKLWSLGLFNQGLTVKVNTETSAVLCGNTLSASEHCVCGNLAAEEMEVKWRHRLWACLLCGLLYDTVSNRDGLQKIT